MVCSRALRRVAHVCVGVGVGGQVPEVVVCFVDPVAGVLLGARPAVAEVGEPGHQGVDDEVFAVRGGVGLWGVLERVTGRR